MHPIKVFRVGLVVAALISPALRTHAIMPSYEGSPLPQAFVDRLSANPSAFQFKRALLAGTERASRAVPEAAGWLAG